MKKSLIALFLVSVFGAAGASTVYTTSSSFLNALSPGYYTENFNRLIGGGSPPSGTVFSGGAFSYNMTTSISTLYSGSNLFGVEDSTSSLTINFLSGNVNAVGANFFETDRFDAFVNSSVSISLSDGTALTYTPTSVSDYRGFIANSGVYLTSLTMAAGGSASGQWESLDNLTVGSAATNNVPEPESLALFGVALAGLGLTRRKAKQA